MEAMRVPFSCYADDCMLSGEMSLEADRLSDFLAETTDFQVDNVVCHALEDGRVVQTGTTELLRDELCLVLATGPRGRPDRRLWTRQLPVRVEVGPYVVLGYLHAPPTIDPIKSNERREVVPLTSCIVRYQSTGQQVQEALDVALLIRRRISDLRYATNGELEAAHDGMNPALEPAEGLTAG